MGRAAAVGTAPMRQDAVRALPRVRHKGERGVGIGAALALRLAGVGLLWLTATDALIEPDDVPHILVLSGRAQIGAAVGRRGGNPGRSRSLDCYDRDWCSQCRSAWVGVC
jgi:hypothetical protein